MFVWFLFSGQLVLLESQLTHLVPKGRARDAQQGSSFDDFATGLAYRILYVHSFGAFANLGETCNALAWLLKQCLLREYGLGRNLRGTGC
jgi:hypothetical protein